MKYAVTALISLAVLVVVYRVSAIRTPLLGV